MRYSSMNGHITRGASLAIGTIIDGHLSDEDVALLYSHWQPNWEEPLAFSGGEKAITCEMVLATDKDAFLKVFGRKEKAIAERIWDVATRNAGR